MLNPWVTEGPMRKAIAIGLVGLALFANHAVAQTAAEQARILGDFERSVVDYTQQHECLVMFPEAASAATPAPKVFTLPVAMVFRQIIADAVIANHTADLSMVAGALPALPARLQYRLNADDLELRDLEDGTVVAVLKDAFSAVAARR